MELTDNDKIRINRFYNRALEQYGLHSHRSLRWVNAADQETRFRVLSNIGPLSGSSILDVGSGLGDLFGYLEHYFKDFSYLGIDIVPDMVTQAKIKYPRGSFEVADIFTLPTKYDYVLASGSLTFHVEGGKKFYYAMIERMFQLANKGLAFNMLDQDVHPIDEEYLAYSQKEISDLCASLTPNYKIVTGYHHGDFTAFLYK